MAKTLVVVESPAKAKTIEKFLGRNYTVRATMGHLRDLPKSQFGVDLENHYEPRYINIRGKGPVIKELKTMAKKSARVLLATDPDREGEAIAWHLAHILEISEQDACRIEFHEITKLAVQSAIKAARPIDMQRVDAQQARRILDRIVGYQLSPLLWRKVRKGLSAGRVQSATVRLIVDREKAIEAFVPEEYWTLAVKLRDNPKGALLEAAVATQNGEKIKLSNAQESAAVETALGKAAYIIEQVQKKERRRMPQAPFTTSTLQQEAAKRLGFTTKKTMMLAQQLYEGMTVGEHGAIGLITYMRTDSTRISEIAQGEAREYITSRFGEQYCPKKPPIYAAKKNAQDAHEAIRPTMPSLAPEQVLPFVSRDLYRLYRLIWTRFTASQMSAALFDTTTVRIKADVFGLKATGSIMRFDGFLALADKKSDELETDSVLPDVTEGQTLTLDKVIPAEQHFTEPPHRYTEATLVKALEEQGIGRPSTYSPTIQTVLERGYVEKEEKKLKPTELGQVVVDLLQEYFTGVVDVAFTAQLEQQLDDVAAGEVGRVQVLDTFYQPFSKALHYADEAIGQVELPVEVSDIPCDKCGRMMVVKHGRFGNFLACPGFPDCRNTKPMLKKVGAACPLCQGEIVERKSKRGKVFYGCEHYPACQFVTWNKPTDKKCPACGSVLFENKGKNSAAATICLNPNCSTAPKGELDVSADK